MAGQIHSLYVLRCAEAIARIGAVTPCRYGAPTVLVVAFDSKTVFTYPGGRLDSGIEDTAIAATHTIMAAADEGVDICWVNFLNPDKMAESLSLPENEEILMVLNLGYTAEAAGPLPNYNSRKPLEDTITLI